VERDGELRAEGPSPTHHNLYPLKARLIQGAPLRVVAERVSMQGHTLRGLVSRIDQSQPYYLLGEVEMPDGRGPALTGRLDRVDISRGDSRLRPARLPAGCRARRVPGRARCVYRLFKTNYSLQFCRFLTKIIERPIMPKPGVFG
jgi:hypothetical protein